MQGADRADGEEPLEPPHRLVGEVAERVTHDLANRLAVARLTAEVLARQPGLAPEIAEQAATIVDSTAEAGELVQLLSALSGRRNGPPHELDVGRLARELEPLLQASAGRRSVDVVTGAAVVDADRRDVEEILVRMVLGARRVGDEPLAVTIVADGPSVALESRRALDDRLDDGARQRLAVLAGRCGGDVDERVEGATTIFTVRLAGRDVAADGASVVGGAAPASVLVVEDDPDLRDLVRGALEADGHDVAAVADAAAALAHPMVVEGRLDLLVTDVELPGESGLQLASRLADTGARLLVISGRSEAALATLLPPGAVVLGKPFGVVDLRASTRRALA